MPFSVCLHFGLFFSNSYLNVRAKRRPLATPLAVRMVVCVSRSESGSVSDFDSMLGFGLVTDTSTTGEKSTSTQTGDIFLRLGVGLVIIGTLGSSSGTWISLSGSITTPESSDSTSIWIGIIRTTGGLRVVDCR